jgi:hypothetical protein
MKVVSGAANFHRNGDINEPAGRSAFEFTGKEVAEALLKLVKETSNPACDVCRVYVKCPECKKCFKVNCLECKNFIKDDDLTVTLVVNFY